MFKYIKKCVLMLSILALALPSAIMGGKSCCKPEYAKKALKMILLKSAEAESFWTAMKAGGLIGKFFDAAPDENQDQPTAESIWSWSTVSSCIKYVAIAAPTSYILACVATGDQFPTGATGFLMATLAKVAYNQYKGETKQIKKSKKSSETETKKMVDVSTQTEDVIIKEIDPEDNLQ